MKGSITTCMLHEPSVYSYQITWKDHGNKNNSNSLPWKEQEVIDFYNVVCKKYSDVESKELWCDLNKIP